VIARVFERAILSCWDEEARDTLVHARSCKRELGIRPWPQKWY